MNMESYSSQAAVSIELLVKEMKKKMFSAQVQSSLVSPSAFDTAWLALIPDTKNTENPMFKCCVDWVLNNQEEAGFWGDDHNLIHTLSSTLACILALATWNVGPQTIELGKSYVVTNAKKLLEVNHSQLPRWFTIVFPAMLKQAETVDVHLNLPPELKSLVSGFCFIREKVDDKNEHRSLKLLSCAEALLSACEMDELVIVNNSSKDGSLFKSPSVSAAAYMATGNPAFLKYLESVIHNFPWGVPSVYPVDEELQKLCLLDKILNLGLAEHFAEEIKETLAQIYRSYNMNSARDQDDIHFAPGNLYKDALAFRLFRFHGFDVTPGLDEDILIQLSVQNYKFRQSIFKNELEELKSWSKQWGLVDMGFGRENTTYCYFAVCGTMYSPHYSVIRKLVTKSAILITVADDFYDMEGSLAELETLTEAVQRWDGEGLIGPSKIIFDALDHFVRDMAEQFLDHERHDMTNKIQALWKESFVSWMKETMWGRTKYTPSADEYLDVGMTSIAAHTIALPSSCFLNQRMPAHKIIHPHDETITKLLMVNARLLNDIQSYQKEQEEGKNNLVLLYLEDNPNADIEDSIEHVKKILNENRMEFLKKVLGDDYGDMPKPCKYLHLSCLKVFEMFFNSSNLFDSKTALLEDIEKAIYIPPRNPLSKETIEPNDIFTFVDVQKKKSFKPLVSNMNVPSSGIAKKLQTTNWYVLVLLLFSYDTHQH
ncbi:putative geranyllinalool synthase [Heracleum sosnowskyi]|uniref:Geranyllinalool synthase n=1 Tax=Heracleum sosnowskyi TaxID=360622 RepID=A0AAD8I3I9_9APIA|nr:putative geranyllinalool synthase [Heracleum sosnowskyi]